LCAEKEKKSRQKIAQNASSAVFSAKPSLVCTQFSIFFREDSGQVVTILDKQVFIPKPIGEAPDNQPNPKISFITAFPL